MPLRGYTRDQAWLLPPSYGDLVPADHAARFVAAFVDALDPGVAAALGIGTDGEERGAPAYHPRLLLNVWLYGFMHGVRPSRKLEVACREHVPLLWLSGGQQPDHNTLWRFYQAHRDDMRALLRTTVQTAVRIGLVDLAVQAIDGSKIAANASGRRNANAAMLRRILARTDEAIVDLEAQNATDDGLAPAHLPAELTAAEELRTRIQEALAVVSSPRGTTRVNLTDPDARFLKASDGYITGYNAQAAASPLASGGGQIVTGAGMAQGNDHAQLVPMLDEAADNTGTRTDTTLADAGYLSGHGLAESAARGQTVLMPERRRGAYHKDAFTYDSDRDTYICPEGQLLSFQGPTRNRRGDTVRRYRVTSAVACRVCPAFGHCTTNARHGRMLEISAYDTQLRRHRELMTTAAARDLYVRRQAIIEPVFSVVKEQLAGRRFLLRGIANVLAEWTLLLTAFNLRALHRAWSARLG